LLRSRQQCIDVYKYPWAKAETICSQCLYLQKFGFKYAYLHEVMFNPTDEDAVNRLERFID